MTQDQLTKHFVAMGARIKFRRLARPQRSARSDHDPLKFTIDIRSDRKRQGEWYFVPSQHEIPDLLVHKNEPLQRTAGSKPYICQELYREGGELVYIVGGEQLTGEEYASRKAEKPDFNKYGLRTMVRNPTVYARGYVRHDDHATITLDGWHRVFISAEIMGSGTVQFLD
jgi:hypothetical protein